jgi:hypothetical protein
VSTMAPAATRWGCARCGVSTGRVDRRRVTLPATWTRSGDGIFCLSCSRALAGEAATESADGSREDLARARRRALIEFEISRCPDATNGAIARACHTSAGAVAAIRETAAESPAGTPGRRYGND